MLWTLLFASHATRPLMCVWYGLIPPVNRPGCRFCGQQRICPDRPRALRRAHQH